MADEAHEPIPRHGGDRRHRRGCPCRRLHRGPSGPGPALAMSAPTATRTAPMPALSPARETVDVEIVVPVYNERRSLEGSIRRLHGFVAHELPLSWRIVIADNGSEDGTVAVARRLSYELPGVDVLGLRSKGRGRALRAGWSGSCARVLCYMDVDLSTDLSALLPLLAPLLAGDSDLAIGTRLHRDARVTRSVKRELISRCYNRLLRLALRAGFSDAQCGFKAVRADAA